MLISANEENLIAYEPVKCTLKHWSSSCRMHVKLGFEKI